MPTPSPLAVLTAALAAVRQQAQQHESLLSKNEAATRAVLLDPVLRSLGWDTADATMVVPEFAVSNKQKPDYFLKSITGATHVVIEAKKLGEDLDKLGHTGKLIGYAFTLKPLYHFVTDGLRWHCFSPKHSPYEPCERITLTKDGLLLAATQLLQLLDATHGGHGLPGALPDPAGAPGASPGRQPGGKALKPSKPRQHTPAAAAAQFTDLASLSTLALQPGQKPAKLQLPDGSIKPLKAWKDLLREACCFVLQHKTHLNLPIPDRAGKKTMLLSWQKPAAGLASILLSYQGKNAFLYSDYDAKGCVANTLYLLNMLPRGTCPAGVAFH